MHARGTCERVRESRLGEVFLIVGLLEVWCAGAIQRCGCDDSEGTGSEHSLLSEERAFVCGCVLVGWLAAAPGHGARRAVLLRQARASDMGLGDGVLPAPQVSAVHGASPLHVLVFVSIDC